MSGVEKSLSQMSTLIVFIILATRKYSVPAACASIECIANSLLSLWNRIALRQYSFLQLTIFADTSLHQRFNVSRAHFNEGI